MATHPIQFLEPDDFKAHEARVCIAEGYVLADPRRPRTFTAEQYFKTPDEMAELFADLPEALANTRGDRAGAATSRWCWARRSCRTFPTPRRQ
ncbi:MAG: hypothetical protein MZW92_35710 [Comamonadaceae bacterium]|nr:hypothetical protein [Comamonadaceae bacterium]